MRKRVASLAGALAMTVAATVAAGGAASAVGAPVPVPSEDRAYQVTFSFPRGDAPQPLSGVLRLTVDAPNRGGVKAFTGTFDPDQNILRSPDTAVPVRGSFSLDPAGVNFTVVLDPRLPEGQQRQVSSVGGRFRADGGFASASATYLRPPLGPFATETGIPRTTAGTVEAAQLTRTGSNPLNRIAGLSTFKGPIVLRDGSASVTSLPAVWALTLNPRTRAVAGGLRLTQGTYEGERAFEVTGTLRGTVLDLQVRTLAPSVPAGQVGKLVLRVNARFDSDVAFRGTATGTGRDAGTVNAVLQNQVLPGQQ